MSLGGIFGSKKKTANELVHSTVAFLDKFDEKDAKTVEKISANLKAIRFMLYGDAESEPKAEVIEKACEEILKSSILVDLVKRLKALEFEARKDAASIYSFVLRRGTEIPSEQYFVEHDEILKYLMQSYDHADTALNCGTILRDCIRFESLCRKMLENEDLFYPFFDLVQNPSFDISADAFATLKLLLTKHKALAAEFLQSNYDKFFGQYNLLIQSKNFVTMRQSLKLLGELLLDRKNFNVMIKYINDPENLKLMMTLLRGKAKSVQFEVFHVFRVFIANPEKSKPVLEILLRNRTKLIEFLGDFLKERDDDEQFVEDKNVLLTILSRLEEPKPEAAKK